MDWRIWDDKPPYKNVVYYWGNSKFSLGYGRTHLENDNTRVNPLLTFKDIKSKKDAGKTFYALFMAGITNEKPDLYWIEDQSDRTSYISSELEELVKRGGKFLKYNGLTYTKVEFADRFVVPSIEERFGTNSLHHILAMNAAGDGDLWGRYSRHPLSIKAMNEIMEEFLWAGQ